MGIYPVLRRRPNATGGMSTSLRRATAGKKLEIAFSTRAETDIRARQAAMPDLKAVITQILATDPRPAYRGDENEDRVFGMRLYDFDLRWRVEGGGGGYGTAK